MLKTPFIKPRPRGDKTSTSIQGSAPPEGENPLASHPAAVSMDLRQQARKFQSFAKTQGRSGIKGNGDKSDG
jgi:hypothetical protein